MAAMIKMYTWWTIRRHKKEQAYKLVAIARRTEVSGSGRADGDVLEMVTVTDATAWKKMKGGAVVFGILPQNFSRDFKFAELKNDNVPGSLRAEMHGAFSLNFDDPESLGAFLFYLPQICQNTKVKNEWDADEIAALLADCEDAVKAGLQTAVKRSEEHTSELQSLL